MFMHTATLNTTTNVPAHISGANETLKIIKVPF